MIGLWLGAALMVLVALIFLLPPLLRSRTRHAPTADRQQLNLAIYRSRLEELESARQADELDEDDYRAAREDLERAMMADVPVVEAESETPNAPHPVTAAVLALAVPVAALGLYLALGNPQALSPGTVVARTTAPTDATGSTTQSLPSVDSMLAQLETRLASHPDDAEGWRLLGRSYTHLERLEDASRAFSRARALRPDNPDAMLDHAEILARLAGNRLEGEAMKLVNRALAVDPSHRRALWLGGFSALQAGDKPGAITHWEKIQALGGLEPEETQMLNRMLARARGEEEVAPKAPAPPPSTASVDGARVTVRVELASELRDQAAPTDTVFIYARAAEGPRIPLAIVRKQVRDLPLTVALDDSMSMSPEFRLSLYPEVIIGARISKSGNARPDSGDLQGSSDRLHTADTGKVSITINKRLP